MAPYRYTLYVFIDGVVSKLGEKQSQKLYATVMNHNGEIGCHIVRLLSGVTRKKKDNKNMLDILSERFVASSKTHCKT